MRRILTVLLLSLCANAYAQVEISAGIGMGTFSMRELKDLQKQIQSGYPVDAKITEQFPAYVIYDASISRKLKSNGFLGIYYQYGSTGGRVHYEDFSGEIYSDQLLHYSTLGLTIGQELALKNNFSLRLDFHPGATFTRLEITDVTKVGNEGYRETYKFRSINATLQPTIELYKSWQQFGIRVFAGFHLAAYSGKLKYEENKEAYLTNGGNDPIVANWNGLRLGITGTYRFGDKEQRNDN